MKKYFILTKNPKLKLHYQMQFNVILRNSLFVGKQIKEIREREREGERERERERERGRKRVEFLLACRESVFDAIFG